MSKYIFENFFIQAPVEILVVPLDLTAFRVLDESGVWDGVGLLTIPEYLATFGHEVKRYNKDKTMFIKGFGFSIKGLDELRAKLTDYGLTEDVNFFILSPEEVKVVLASEDWVEEVEQ